MVKSSPPITFRFHAVLFILFAIGLFAGCSHDSIKRGHVFRCVFEFNRTPWDGCAADSGCGEEDGEEGSKKCSTAKKGIFGCLKKGSDDCSSCEDTKKNKGFRRHCGLNSECTAKNPCCRTLGCGMWIDPSDPNSFATTGTGIKACGLTPFCSPMKPCGLTPNCGRTINPSNQNLTNLQLQQQQTLMLGNNGTVMPGMQPSIPTPNFPKRIETQPGQLLPNTPNVPGQQNSMPNQMQQPPKSPTLAGPNGLLISMGIVPGVSTITTGGVVAAAGVITPVGMMTPAGVRLPSGVVNPNVVIKACGMSPNCSAAHPCGMMSGCGMMVPVNMVSNNAVMLASALQAPGVAGGVLQTGGMMMGNPIVNQTMNGIAQTGYMTNNMQYAGLGYSNAAGIAMTDEEDEEEQPEIAEADMKSKMPLPRFHSMPTKPVFQRSEGLPVLPGNGIKKSSSTGRTSAANSKQIFSEESLNEAMEQAYLEGMSAAMEKVEEELDANAEILTAQTEEKSKIEIQERILDQAQKLQAKIDKQKELEQQLYQESLRKEAQLLARQDVEQQKEQLLKEQQALEVKNAKRLAAREQAIRDEAAQQLAEREQAIREETAKEIAVQGQMMQAQLERQARLLEAAQIQQVRMAPTQMKAQANHSVQPIPVNGIQGIQDINQGMPPMPGSKTMFTSALSFLKGNDQRIPPQMQQNNLSMMGQNRIQQTSISQSMPQYSSQYSMPQPMPQYVSARPMMPQQMEPNGTQGFGLYQSAKSKGMNLLSTLSGAVSPLSGMFGSEMPSNMRVQPEQQAVNRSVNRSIPVPASVPFGNSSSTIQPPMNQVYQPGQAMNRSASAVSAASIPSQPTRPVRQAVQSQQGTSQGGLQNFSLTQMMPVPHLQGNIHSQKSHSKDDCPDCTPARSFLAETKPLMSKKQVPFPVISGAEENGSEITVSEMPRKPPTMAKPRKIIAVDDDDEPMIRQAMFEDRDSRR